MKNAPLPLYCGAMRRSFSVTSTPARLVLAAGSAVAVGCGGPSVADLSSQEITLTVQGITSAPELVAIGKPPEAGIGVSRALIRASAVSFEPCSDDIASLKLAPRGYELLHDPAPSETVTTAVREYCGLQLRISSTTENSADDVPEGATLYVEVKDDSGDELVLQTEETVTLAFRTEAGESFGAEPLLLGIDVAAWLADVPLDEEERDGASERLHQQLPAAAALYVDANGNGELDEDERTPLLESEP